MMRKSRHLALFCSAGGACVGYHRAGFDTEGVDILPQPRYPFRFHQFEPGNGLILYQPAHRPHRARTATTRRRERWNQGWHVSVTGDVGTYVGPEAMGIDWMTGDELSQAIPPVMTEYVGRQILSQVNP